VVDLQGQGNFSCADMSPGPDGGAMQDISGHATFTPNAVSTTQITIDVSGTQLPSNEIDAVYIEAKGNGARCLYSFSDYSPSAINLEASGDSFTSADVVVCADGVGEEPPEEPTIVEPVSTIGDDCQGKIVFDENSPDLEGLAVVSAVSLDGQTLAVCSGDGTTTQVQCVNTCENFIPRADDTENYTCSATTASRELGYGQLDLDQCRPCNLTDPYAPPATDRYGNPVFYCWEYTNSVVRDLSDRPDPIGVDYYPIPGAEFVPGTNVPRENDTLLPHKQAWSAAEETETFNGCYKKTVYLNGRAYTYTTCY
jgi:hypothetical protein